MALPYITFGQLNKAIEEFKSSNEMFKVPDSEGTWIWCCINGKLQWARTDNNSAIEINLPDNSQTSSENSPSQPDSGEENHHDNDWKVINLTRAEFNDGSDFHMRIIDLDKETVTLLDMGEMSQEELALTIAANTHKLCKTDGSFMVFEDVNLEQGVAMTYMFEQHGLTGVTTLPISTEYGDAFANFEGSRSSQMSASALGFNEVRFIATADYEDKSADKDPDDIVFTIMCR